MPWKKRNPSTHVIEQDDNGNVFSVESVYLVKQNQAYDGYFDKTIYVYTDEDKATEVCRKLNKEYGTKELCEFTEDWDFVEVKDPDFYAEAHFYTVEEILLNEEYE